MSRFNLLDEPWISVVFDEKGSTKEVSLLDFFQNAHHYKDLAGDTKTQDFAVLRVLLAVLHTVFSRFDANGNVYGYLEIDEKYRQIEEIEEDDLEEYEDDLYETWLTLWQNRQFPDIIEEYLKKWRDRFYLFDEEYPFFQVRKEDIEMVMDLNKDAGKIFGKNINRLVSESSNKIALFSPKHNYDNNKERLSNSEIVRWLLTYHGYSEIGGRMKKIGKRDYSKGWLYNLGGLFLKGKNLYETLLLNLTLFYFEYDNHLHIQKPCWEFDSAVIIDSYVSGKRIDNLASLYTSWSKEVYIDPHVVQPEFECRVAKIPAISPNDLFLEPMTLWKYEENSFQPQSHYTNQSLWRSFGLITMGGMEKLNHIPGIIDWQRTIKDNIENASINICSVGMVSDKTANNTPIIEVFDTLSINEFVLTDIQKDGWVIRINDEVDRVKKVISHTYAYFVKDVIVIRKHIEEKEIPKLKKSILRGSLFRQDYEKQISNRIEELYFKIDQPFRQWLSNIQPGDDKDSKILEWREILEKIVLKEAKSLLYEGNPRDYIGWSYGEPKTFHNIATAYESFTYWLNKNLK
ncbi:type I-E CRISPR-associated protein Cse1/CasA [Streptococcus mutans]|uniref:type I-E CRISPR-associated protein Cse1/CasA n=1 Tax=Streptococcus mutans TaxID=1309 RepID=UPI00066B9535|nr:type I-E CRISPR-associated protein Cse1/CasA [Streptococcus mutans]MCB5111586.1 type I-E CRISPR-associated protein Cse1/CasA [Streptococcus mutans]MCB5137876.1 type I-E CRISPR-associated protein Cse1/CasA [Streptococcus mutans]MCY7115295.1 type I-E CRISPR-associated protein Cse1/CasA [Streptococcus mutans]